jgi:hypothetical protein
MTGRWFSSKTPVFSTSKTDSRDIAEILLKVIDLAFVIEYETLCLKRGDNPITVGWFMLFNATFNNISAISRLSVLR